MPTIREPRVGIRLSDVVVVALIMIFALLPFPDDTFRARGLLFVPALVAAAVMPFRRRRPLVVLAISLLCAVASAAARIISPSALLAAAIGCYSAIDRRGRGIGLIAVAVSAVVVFLSNGWALAGDLLDSTALQFVLLVVLGGALGDAARSRREFAAAMIERAERAERNRDDEARRRVAEERVRLARDLHDVVAHQIAVISLNAGVASSALDSRPERAREALTTVRSASRTVLGDIGGLMSLLRSDALDDPEDRRPQSGLAQLDTLIDGFRRGGLRVDLRRQDDAFVLSPASDHAAYLVLQEALTNAHKHGLGGTATVALRIESAALHLTIVNPTRNVAPPSPAPGNGLRGIQERLAAVRGAAHFGSDRGVFSLEAWIPVEGVDTP